METQTRFDLNAAIEGWRQELTTQPNLTAEVRRELETHLRDAITGFQQRGLNDEESFWLASKRVGQPSKLGDEFIKANPEAVWRERIFWMAVALLLIAIWSNVCSLIMNVLRSLFPDFSWLNFAPGSNFIFIVLQASPLICFAFLLTHNRAPKSALVFLSFFKSRRRFALIIVGMLVFESFNIASGLHSASLNHDSVSTGKRLAGLLLNTTWPIISITLISWLLPPQHQKFSKRAKI